jgi:hypothetical protein
VKVGRGAAAVLADADRRAAELLFRGARLAEGAAGVVAAEEGDPGRVGAAAGRRLDLLGLGEIEERFQIRKVARRNGSRIVHADGVFLVHLARPDEIADVLAVEDVRLKARLVD